MYVQPIFDIPSEIESGVLEGIYKIWGGIVREVDTGRIVKHLQEITPRTDEVEQAIRRLNPKVAGVALGVVAALGAATAFTVQKRREATVAAEAELRAPVANFETSLREYVRAGKEGALTAGVVQRLIHDLDAIKLLAEQGDDVRISFDQLAPLFELVIAHTPKLAEAYDIELEALSPTEDDVVISLRRHLEVQRAILDEAA